jgi:Domain of unknown function (DUF4440)
MNKTLALGMAVLALSGAQFALAGGDAELIALDKKWGESQGSDAIQTLLADDLVAIGPQGLGSKADLVADAASAEAPEGPYMAGDYKVNFLASDVAIMTHSTGGDDPHWSMHVWHKRDGKWQVAATASTPQGK